jgi:hypothetical protein
VPLYATCEELGSVAACSFSTAKVSAEAISALATTTSTSAPALTLTVERRATGTATFLPRVRSRYWDAPEILP